MMKKILLVDDEPDIIEFLNYNLEKAGYEVLVGANGKEALKLLEKKPDLVILDIMMPEMNGFEVYEKIRSNNHFNTIPIIFLTAKSGESDEIKGLEIGASDYIQKPISPKKLLARVELNLRKQVLPKPGKTSNVLTKIGPLVIDIEKYSVTVDSRKKVFPRKEFQLLHFLANNPDKVFSRDNLLKEVWGTGIYVVDRTVDVHIRKIREKLGKHSDLIETIKGVGYRFSSAK
jgi:two-component system, OmpR family, alkaline phosphatase synthesis response regulator PhoP